MVQLVLRVWEQKKEFHPENSDQTLPYVHFYFSNKSTCWLKSDHRIHLKENDSQIPNCLFRTDLNSSFEINR